MKIFFSILGLVLLSSCQIPQSVEKTFESMKVLVGMGFQTPSPSGIKPVPSTTPRSTETNEGLLKANAELLSEIIRITFAIPEIEDQDQFRSLLSSLQQGASIEGIYRGLVMGSHYRALETRAKAAAPNAVKFFALEMAELQLSMKNPTKFDKNSAKNYPTIEFPDGLPESVDLTPEVQSGEKKEPQSKQERAEEILQTFIGATSFALKRVMSEEILKKMDEQKNSPADMAHWFATTAIRLNVSKMDFGLPQRSSPDFEFHHKFAKAVSPDRLRWEVLNRYHRIFNNLN